MSDINNAANVYLNTLKNMQNGGKAEPRPEQAGGPSFGDILKTSLEGAIDAQHKSEQVSAKALVGEANMTEVLAAINEAELKLDAVLAIRDKVVNAYEQIMRTPI